MDDYKEKLIKLVHSRPLLWNPHVPNYKDKDQRLQVWEELATILTEPKGTTHKDAWESLIRCHCNALKRTVKRSGRRADNPKPWKFLKHMEFLIPIKDIRNSKGNLLEASDEATKIDFNVLPAPQEDADIVTCEGEGVEVPELAVALAGKMKGSEQGGRQQKKKKKVEDSEDPILSLVGEKQERKPESPRMGFFHSIMPRVDSLEEDVFQEFQLQTLLLLKNLHAQQTQQGH